MFKSKIIFAVLLALLAVSTVHALESKDFFAELVSNEVNLNSGQAIFKFCNPTVSDFSGSQIRGLNFDFVEKANSIKTYDVYMLQTTKEVIKVSDKCINQTENIAKNMTKTTICNEWSTKNVTIEHKEWIDIDMLKSSDKLYSTNCSYIKLETKFKKSSYQEPVSIDWIPAFDYGVYSFDYKDWAWFNATWTYRVKVPINSSVITNVSNAKTYIEFDTASLISAGKMNASCKDIRITNETDYVLTPDKIMNCSSATTNFWINMPLVKAENTSYIYIYYGNPNAEILEDYDAVWTDAIELEPLEDNLASTNVWEKVNSYNHTATANTNALTTTGIFNAGFDVDSTDYYYNLDNTYGAVVSDSISKYGVSVCGFLKADTNDWSAQGTQHMFQFEVDANDRYFLRYDTSDVFTYSHKGSGTGKSGSSGSSVIDTTDWFMWCAVVDRASSIGEIFIDGDNIVNVTGLTAFTTNTGDMYWVENAGLNAEWDGQTDHNFIINRTMSRAEIKLLSGQMNKNLFEIGSEETQAGATFLFADFIAPTPANNSNVYATYVFFNITFNTSSPVTWALLNVTNQTTMTYNMTINNVLNVSYLNVSLTNPYNYSYVVYLKNNDTNELTTGKRFFNAFFGTTCPACPIVNETFVTIYSEDCYKVDSDLEKEFPDWNVTSKFEQGDIIGAGKDFLHDYWFYILLVILLIFLLLYVGMRVGMS